MFCPHILRKSEKLFVNAKVGEGGHIKAAVMSPEKTPVSGYGLSKSVPTTGDSVKSSVAWEHGHDVSLRPGDHVRLKFELKNAQLYSFWIE